MSVYTSRAVATTGKGSEGGREGGGQERGGTEGGGGGGRERERE